MSTVCFSWRSAEGRDGMGVVSDRARAACFGARRVEAKGQMGWCASFRALACLIGRYKIWHPVMLALGLVRGGERSVDFFGVSRKGRNCLAFKLRAACGNILRSPIGQIMLLVVLARNELERASP